MKNRKFLVPLATLASVFIANPAAASTETADLAKLVPQVGEASVSQSQSDVFSFTLKRSDQEIQLAGHRSHSSHSSHSSHRSHYSSR